MRQEDSLHEVPLVYKHWRRRSAPQRWSPNRSCKSLFVGTRQQLHDIKQRLFPHSGALQTVLSSSFRSEFVTILSYKMRFNITTIVPFAIILISAVLSQNVTNTTSSQPPCLQGCANKSALALGCTGATDLKCYCAKEVRLGVKTVSWLLPTDHLSFH